MDWQLSIIAERLGISLESYGELPDAYEFANTHIVAITFVLLLTLTFVHDILWIVLGRLWRMWKIARFVARTLAIAVSLCAILIAFLRIVIYVVEDPDIRMWMHAFGDPIVKVYSYFT